MKAKDISSILNMELWPRRKPRATAWPLLFVAALSYLALAAIFLGFSFDPDSMPFLAKLLVSLVRPPAVWVISGIWLVVDLGLLHWSDRWVLRGREASRPVRLFFLWQVAKLAFCLIYPALVYAYHFPF